MSLYRNNYHNSQPIADASKQPRVSIRTLRSINVQNEAVIEKLSARLGFICYIVQADYKTPWSLVVASRNYDSCLELRLC